MYVICEINTKQSTLSAVIETYVGYGKLRSKVIALKAMVYLTYHWNNWGSINIEMSLFVRYSISDK